VSAVAPTPRKVDLWEILGRFEERPFKLSADGLSISLTSALGGGPSVGGSIRRYYGPGTPELGALLRLVGAYISEGSASIIGVTSVRTYLSVAQNRREWLGALLEDLRTISDASAHVSNVGGDMWALRSGALLAHFFWALCGIKSRGKKLPSFAFELSDLDFLKLWEKLVEGDGSVDPAGRRVYTTISQRLAAGISFALDQHGVEHALCYRHEKGSWALRERSAGSERKGSRSEKVVRRIADDEYVYDLSVEGAHTFVDGVGRVLLHNTDCCVTRAILPTSDKLGDLKLERDIKEGEFYAPKFYRIDGNVKAKGFSGITSDGFQLLVEGYAGQFERQARPREMLRRCDLTPQRLHIPKQLRFRVEDEKRVFSRDGENSRPYTVKEILMKGVKP
jgi:hypothetical protein